MFYFVYRPSTTTTEFCVIPIEDDVQDVDSVSPEPADPPSRTVTSLKDESSRSKVYLVPDSILLPGTPDIDGHGVKFQPAQDTGTTNHIDLDGEEEHYPGGSPCASSVSSTSVSSIAGSIKSTDLLLPSSSKSD